MYLFYIGEGKRSGTLVRIQLCGTANNVATTAMIRKLVMETPRTEMSPQCLSYQKDKSVKHARGRNLVPPSTTPKTESFLQVVTHKSPSMVAFFFTDTYL